MWETDFYVLEKAYRRYPYSLSCVRKRKAVIHLRLAMCDWKTRRFAGWLNNGVRAFTNDPSRSIRVLLGAKACGARHR
jgi:hypothetical protein